MPAATFSLNNAAILISKLAAIFISKLAATFGVNEAHKFK